MKQETLDVLISEYLSSDISEDKKKEIKNELLRSGYDQIELEEMEHLYAKLDEIHVPETSKKLEENFYRSLEIYKDAHGHKIPIFNGLIRGIRNVFTQKYVIRLAYSLILVVFGWFLGNWSNQNGLNNTKINAMSRELNQMKQVMMVTMLEQPSATTRIKAMSYADDFEKVDNKILNAFLATLNNDPNPNVRLSAVEALSKYSDNKHVRNGLVKSISGQESPLVQVALIDLMLKLKEKASIKEFNRLLQNKDLNYSVRNKTKETIRLL